MPLRAQALAAEEARLLRGFQFLSQKPILHCLNLAEDAVEGRALALSELDEVGKRPATLVGWVSAAVEGEVAALAPEEQRSFLDALGLPEPALHRVIRDAYTLLGLASFFTVGEDEVRAWTIPAGAAAVDAAGAIHSDIARGFIRAEVIGWAELLRPDRWPRRGSARSSGSKARTTPSRTARSATSASTSAADLRAAGARTRPHAFGKFMASTNRSWKSGWVASDRCSIERASRSARARSASETRASWAPSAAALPT